MAYNKDIHKTDLNEITKDLFKQGIFLAYRDGITSMAPMGFSGDDISLYGEEIYDKDGKYEGRRSVVSLRNYCGCTELLITDKKGSFLFYGKYHIDLGLDFVCEQYWQIFNLVKDKIDIELPKCSNFERSHLSTETKFAANCQLSEGFEILKGYQENQKANGNIK